ncbi:MAG: phosphate regulon sensor histidine kinase PhoR [Burkholderiales bacterium]|nr:phosphate regulon sensor histidine kinase PhoR [Burkholderiales bacterium]
MNQIWRRGLTTIVTVTMAWLAVWFFFGKIAALLVCAFSLILLGLHQLGNLSKLYEWLAEPDLDALPRGSGAWHSLFYRLHRTERKRAKRLHELNASLDRLRDASEAMPYGVVILNLENRIEWFNSAAQEHFGLNSAQDFGYFIGNLVRLPDFIGFLDAKKTEALVLRSVRGSGLSLSVKQVAIGDRQKLLLSRDITQFERVDRMRRDFVANVSHELKTPLTVLSGFIETFEDLEFDQNQIRQYLGMMREQTSSMLRLVDDLLVLSALESEDNRLREERVGLRTLLESIHQDARVLSAGRHTVTLKLGVEADLRGNERELRSAFGNLVSNAIRYTPTGGKIALSWRLLNGQGFFTVEDTGIGIERQHLPRLTERFYRVDRSRSRETGGTGLGLAIVKHVVSRHDATLEVTSEPGKGSCFSVRFPKTRVLLPEFAGKAV